MASDPLKAENLMGHVKDSDTFHVPRALAEGGEVKIPQPFILDQPIQISVGFKPIDDMIEPLDLKITKFMVLEVVGAVLIAVIFIALARKMSSSIRPRGKVWNLFESMLVFIRDEVARPAIGHHDADRFLPFLWTMFFFVLAGNLLGMFPWSGSFTGALATTGALAFITFSVVVAAGMAKMGPLGYITGLVPHMDLPLPLMIVLWPMIFLIEVLGLLIKHFILAVRLLANMMAGHLVLAVIIAFIWAAAQAGEAVMYGVAPISVLGAVALSLLELFVAFLQAYIFTFLASLFIGMAVHPH